MKREEPLVRRKPRGLIRSPTSRGVVLTRLPPSLITTVLEIETTILIDPRDGGPWHPRVHLKGAGFVPRDEAYPYLFPKGTGTSCILFGSPSHLLLSLVPNQLLDGKPSPPSTLALHRSLFALSGEQPLPFIAVITGDCTVKDENLKISFTFHAHLFSPPLPPRRYPATIRFFRNSGVHAWIHLDPPSK